MQCPVCNAKMWSKAESKFPQKETAPDFKCGDKECKFKLNQETGEYEPGEYTTGVWLKKEPGVKKVVVSNAPPTHKGMDDDFGYRCNALNNATILMKEAMRMGANYEKEALALYYNDCLEILKG